MSASPVSQAKRKQILRIIFISLLLDLVSFTFILPLFPKLLEFYRNLETSQDSSSLLNRVLYGLNTYKQSFSRPISGRYDIVLLGGALGSLFSFLQAIASPVIGRLSDRYGRRTALLWSMAGNVASVALWVAATDFRTFLASRVVGGLSEGNVQLAIAMAADISDDKQRGATMALVGVCFSIAFTFGPALGAALANVETVVANPFATAAGFSLFLIVVETAYLYFYLPETLPSSRAPSTANDLVPNGKALQQSKPGRTNSHTLLNFTHFIFIFFFSGMEFSLPFMTYDLFAYSSSQSGKLLGFMGLIAAILQGSVTRQLHPLKVVQLGVVACAVSFFMLAQLTTEAGLWAAATLLAITTATVVTGLNSLSSFEAAEGERGGKLGNHRSWGQIGRSCGPLFFCTLYWWAGRDVAYSVGGVGMLGVCAVVFGGLKAPKKSLAQSTSFGCKTTAPLLEGSLQVSDHYYKVIALVSQHILIFLHQDQILPHEAQAMAQAQATRFNNVIDLTEDDDDDGQLEALSEAASKAEAAADRVTSRLQSMTSASTVGRTDTLNDRIATDNIAITPTANSVWTKAGEGTVPGTRFPLLNNSIRSPSTGHGMRTSRPRGPIQENASLAFAQSDRPESPETANDGAVTHASAVRSPRAAAHYTGQNLARTYDILNPLEAQRGTSVHSPKKPGGPKLDQWTPKWTPKTAESPSDHETEKDKRTDILNESNPGSARSQISLSPTKAGSSEPASNVVRPNAAPAMKRKRSSVSPQLDVSAKLVRKESSQSRYSSGIPGSLEDGKSITPSSGRPDWVEIAQPVHNNVGSLGKRDHGLLTTGLENHQSKTVSQQKIMLSSVEIGPLFEIFKNVVYPALKRAKKRAKQSLSEDELMSIGKSVAIEVVDQRLITYVSQGQPKPNDAQRADLQEFVKRCFREKVQEAVARSDETRRVSEDQHHPSVPGRTNGIEPHSGNISNLSANIALRSLGQAGIIDEMTTANPRQSVLSSTSKLAASGPSAANPPEKITDLSGYLRKLENEVLPTDLDEFDYTSPVRAQASISGAVGKETVTEPSSHQPSPPTSLTDADRLAYDSLNDYAPSLRTLSPTSVPISDTAHDDPNSPSESSFPPGFDRGRYPAQRRRRANKYYTPTARPSESVTSRISKPSVSASQPSRPASKKTQVPSATGASMASEDVISQMLIARVATDPYAKALLEVIASGIASPIHKAEFQALIDELTTAKLSQKGGEVPDSTVHSTGLHRISNNSRRTNRPGSLERSSSSSTSGRLAGSVLPTEKDQVRLLKALANHPEGSKASNKATYGQQNGRSITGVPSTEPGASFESTSSVTSAPKSGSTVDSGSSTPYVQDHSKTHVASQRNPNHLKKGSRPRTSAVIHLQTVEKPPVSRLPATALDPQLERLVADLIANEPGDHGPWKRKDRHFIDYTEQEELLGNEAIIRYADIIPKEQETELLKADNPSFTMIETRVIDPARRPQRHISSLLRHRELGLDSRGRNVDVQRELRLRRSEMIEPWRYWKGASGDIVAAAWGPDSTTYAVGAAAHTNPEDVQYNRPCNLLLGDLIHNTLTELPDHRVDRPKPETLTDTYNARQAVYEACDPMVYETVSHIAFSPTTDRMYTASHDRTVKIWNTSAPQQCLTTLQHDAHVTSVEVSAHRPGLFATGSAVIENAVRVYYTENDYILHVDFSSSRAVAKPAWKIYPECLRWGSTASSSHLLLAGFHQNDTDEPSQEGQLCLWDANAFQFIKVVPSSQSVLAAAWHPTLNFFATGGAPGGNLLTDKYKTKTVVRTWDLRAPTHYSMEYECSALDMQDITFHPTDSNIVTAGCTDGTSFVWDYRRPDYPLHRLRHGMPLVDWDHTRGSREEVDTGVMMSLWGPGESLFYTGSSDGMIKAWDIRRHPQDVMVRNVALFGAGIQSGAFSPDGTNLLVGDADGGVHVLSSAPCGPQPIESGSDDVSPELPITLVRAPDGSGLTLSINDDDPGSEGIEAAKNLTNSGQIIFDSEFGVTQGPSYETPYAAYARREAADPDAIHFHANKGAEAKQFFLRTHEETEEVENIRRGMIAARKQRIAQFYPETKAAQQKDIRRSEKGFRDGLLGCISSYHPGYDRSVLSTGDKTFDPDPDYPMVDAPPSNQRPASTWDSITASSKWTGGHGHSILNLKMFQPPMFESLDANVEDNMISESEMVEQNYWWPRLNEDEIERARAGKGHKIYTD